MRGFVSFLSRLLVTVWCYSFFVLGSVLWGVLVIPLTIVLSRFEPRVRDLFTDCTQAALGIFIKLLPFMKLSVDRSRRLRDGCRVLVVNHQSWLDPIVMLSLERRLSGPARGYLFRTPIIRSVLKLGRFYLSDGGEPAPLERMRRGVEEALAHRGTLLFYPEGTRTRTGRIGDFRLGAFRMAVEYKLPIQPVVIDGLGRVFPPGSVILQTLGRHLVRVRYLDPIEPPYGEGPQRRIVREIAQQVRTAMVEELARLRTEGGSAGGSGRAPARGIGNGHATRSSSP
jgi:1-acyl-sn-glycerol-3-phosphate acyltransferase